MRKFRTRIFATAIMALGLATGSASAQTVGIATGNPGSLFHNIGTAIAKASNDAGVPATIQPATSPTQYMPLVNAGEIEFGVGNLQEFHYALEGKEWFAGSVNGNLRVVGMIMPIREAIFVRADSDIKSIADLKGKSMVDGFTAQQTILPQLEAIYGTAGFSRSDVKAVNVASVVAGVNAFLAGDVTGFIFAHGAGKVREAHAASGGLRALPIEDTPEALAAIKAHWPTGYLVTLKPGPGTPGVEAEGKFIAYPQLLFTHADVSDEVVYAMAKVLYEQQGAMAETFPAFRGFNPARDLVQDTTPAQYHAGAVAYFKEVGLWKE